MTTVVTLRPKLESVHKAIIGAVATIGKACRDPKALETESRVDCFKPKHRTAAPNPAPFPKIHPKTNALADCSNAVENSPNSLDKTSTMLVGKGTANSGIENIEWNIPHCHAARNATTLIIGDKAALSRSTVMKDHPVESVNMAYQGAQSLSAKFTAQIIRKPIAKRMINAPHAPIAPVALSVTAATITYPNPACAPVKSTKIDPTRLNGAAIRSPENNIGRAAGNSRYLNLAHLDAS